MKALFYNEMKRAQQFLSIFYLSGLCILSCFSSLRNAVSEYKPDQYSAWNVVGNEEFNLWL